MSSAVVSTPAALGRPFVFDDDADPEVCPLFTANQQEHTEVQESAIVRVFQSTIKNQRSKIPLAPASRLEIRPAPEMVPSGIPALDALTGGLPRGCVTEICGPASSGRTSLLLAALAAATRRGEFCALLDACDALDPHSTADAGVDLDRLLWVRCGDDLPQKNSEHRSRPKQGRREVGISAQSAFDFDRSKSRASEHRLEQLLRATDMLLESGGFGMIVLDLADLPPQSARRIPLTTWFRFRRAIERTPTMLLAIEQHPIAGSCSSLLLQLGSQNDAPQIANPPHAQLLTGLTINVELIRSRIERKPARSVTFESKTAWAG